MRLTLRTLLAYLDDILEPTQARDIGAKIAESSMAQDLVNRLKEVTRRRRLLAPDVEGPGAGLDPNLVAEYLDNTLPPDDVSDIERVCLESDIHLAEVAASHQILTLVLGEPVAIVPRSRERMYALGPVSRHSAKEFASADRKGLTEPSSKMEEQSRVALASGNGSGISAAESKPDRPAKAVTAVSVSAAETSRFNDRIPEYLRPKPIWQRLLPWFLIAGFGGVFVYLIANDPAFRKEGTATTSASTDPAAGQNDSNAGGSAEPAVAATAAPPRAAGSNFHSNTTATIPPNSTKPVERTTIDPPPPDDVAGGKPIVETKPPVEIATVTKPSVPATVVKPMPIAPADSGSGKPGEPTPAADPAGNVEKGEPVAAAAIEYASVEGVLLHQNRTSRGWLMLPRRSVVKAGDRLAAPEPFESTLSLENGRALITVQPGSQLQILGPTADAPFGISVRNGRLVINTQRAEAVEGQQPSVKLNLVQGDQSWLLDLDGVGTQAAFEVIATEPESFEQDLGQKGWSGRLSIVTGAARLTQPSGKKVTLDARSAISLMPKSDMAVENLVVAGAEMPRWIEPAINRSPNRRYAVQFEKEFDPKISIGETLPAIVNSPTFQLSELATRALALTGDSAALIQALARSPHKETKLAAIHGLRLWLGESVAHGAVLKEQLVMTYPAEDVETIYRLLWGFSNADAGDPDRSQQLVDLLEHDQVAVRELAFFHLHRITGLNYNYDAQLPLPQRTLSVNRWRMHLKKEGGSLLKK